MRNSKLGTGGSGFVAEGAGLDVPRMVICLVGKGGVPFPDPICCTPAIAAVSRYKMTDLEHSSSKVSLWWCGESQLV
jgi:hypothetical protein